MTYKKNVEKSQLLYQNKKIKKLKKCIDIINIGWYNKSRSKQKELRKSTLKSKQ